jgi:HAD superfamily hydrolase (TIGR01662 family)
VLVVSAGGLLVDYGGTLVEEVGFDARSGNEVLWNLAAYRPPTLTFDQVLDRAQTVTEMVADRRDQFGIETPWPALTRLIHDYLGVRFELAMNQLELAFWKASVTTAPVPGAIQALSECHRRGTPMAVVSNSSFGAEVIRYELEKHSLAEYLAFIMVSSEYAVRKPNVLLFSTAAARLGISPQDVWFVGDRLDTDIRGAQAAKMKPVWLCRESTPAPAGDGYLVADSWQAILSHMGM